MTKRNSGTSPRIEAYRQYIVSPEWRVIRQAAMERAGFRCEVCGGKRHLQVHHIRYPRLLGTETPDMLKTLCDTCHAEAHGRPYILVRPPAPELRERKKKLKEIQRTAKAVVREKNRLRREAKTLLWRERVGLANETPTPSLKDRY